MSIKQNGANYNSSVASKIYSAIVVLLTKASGYYVFICRYKYRYTCQSGNSKNFRTPVLTESLCVAQNIFLFFFFLLICLLHFPLQQDKGNISFSSHQENSSSIRTIFFNTVYNLASKSTKKYFTDKYTFCKYQILVLPILHIRI